MKFPNCLGTANGGQNFADLINDLAAFNPAPVSKDKTLKKGKKLNGFFLFSITCIIVVLEFLV